MKERKLRNATRKKIDEIEILKEEVKNNDDELLMLKLKFPDYLLIKNMKKYIYYMKYF